MKKFMPNFGTKKQILFIVCLMVSSLVASSVFFLNQQKKSQNNLSTFYHDQFVPVTVFGDYRAEIFGIRYTLASIAAQVLPGPSGARALETTKGKLITDWANIEKSLDSSLAQTPEFEKEIDKIKKGHETLLNVIDLSIASANSHNADRIKGILQDEWVDVVVLLENPIREIYNTTSSLALQKYQTTSLETEEFVRISLIAAIILISILLIVSFVVMRNITKNFEAILKLLNITSEQISSVSENVFTGSEELSKINQQQANNLIETSASLTEISQMVERNVDFTQSARGSTSECLKLSNDGKMVVEQVISSITKVSDINKDVIEDLNNNNNQIKSIISVVSKIAEKTKMINDIVFQTKLLSFNASVEAARAGEAGKGFAVVAEEIANLAQNSGMASQEISTILDEGTKEIDKIIKDIEKSVESMAQNTTTQIDKSILTARECNKSLDEIIEKVNEVDSMMSEITSASTEQSTGVKQIDSAIQKIESESQNASKVSEQSLENSEKLIQSRNELDTTISKISTVIFGHIQKKDNPRESLAYDQRLKEDDNEENQSLKAC